MKIKKPMVKNTFQASSLIEPQKFAEDFVEIVYIGVSELARRIGYVTGTEYIFSKDQLQKPKVTKVIKKDVPALLQERGRGCFRRDPEAIFILKSDWDNNC